MTRKKLLKGSPRLQEAGLFILFAAVATLLYAPALSGPFLFDDHFTITENPLIKSPGKWRELWAFDPSRFLTYGTFVFNYHFSGNDTFSYHAVNLLLHIVVTGLVYALLKNILPFLLGAEDKASSSVRRIAAVAALIFLIHPVQTQAVSYISQRATLLAALCYLSVFLSYLFYRRQGRRSFYFLALGAALAGVFCKPIIVTLPAALWLWETVFFQPREARWSRVARRLWPFFLVVAVVPLLLMQFQHRVMELSRFWQMARLTANYSRWEYGLTQIHVLMTYARLLFFPFNQNLDYDYPITQGLGQLSTWMCLLALAGLLFWGIKMYRRHKVFCFGIFWVFLTLSVESSIFPIPDVINEHRLYLPMMGFALMIAYGGHLTLPRSRYAIISLLVLCAWAGATYKRNHVWADEMRMWQDIVRQSPGKARGHVNLGNLYYGRREFDKAKKEYQRAIALAPDYAHAYNNLGGTYLMQGNKAAAEQYLKKAIEFYPNYFSAYVNLGDLYWDTGKGDAQKAGEAYLRALAINPYYAPAVVALGRLHLGFLNFVQAKFYLSYALELDPACAQAYAALGEVYTLQESFDQAMYYYQEALKRDERLLLVHINRGNIFAMRQEPQKALAAYQRAIDIDPDDPRAYYNLANLLDGLGDRRARDYYLRALQRYQSRGEIFMAEKIQERITPGD